MTSYKHKETEALRQTIEQIRIVQQLLASGQIELLNRQLNHDRSKLNNPEWSRVLHKFDKEEFPMSEQDLDQAKHHHYAHNRHHPQKFENGIDDMNIFDIVEMIIDWIGDAYADKEDVKDTIKRKAEEYNINPQLINIFLNTSDWAKDSAYIF